jgi:hypothetical protein
MDRVYLEWNIVNWITVVLMVVVFYAVIGGAVSLMRQYLPGGSATQAAQ